jgi:transposase
MSQLQPKNTRTKAVKRQYTPQTKADAVGQVIKDGKPIPEVAQLHEIPLQTLTTWVATAKKSLKTAATRAASDSVAELSKLRAEVAMLKMERDILKKATAYFAKDIL